MKLIAFLVFVMLALCQLYGMAHASPQQHGGNHGGGHQGEHQSGHQSGHTGPDHQGHEHGGHGGHH